MSKLLSPAQGRIAIQICAVTAVAALMSGCSADSTRFGDAFGNPFATGSIAKPKHVAVRKPPTTGTGPSAPVVASALPPRSTSTSGSTPVRTAPAAVSHETTGSITPARTVPGASFGNWSVQGGTAVEVAQGDTAPILAQRYGVPENVLLQVNGLHSAAEIQPGSRITIPIYNAAGSGHGEAPRVAEAPPRAEPPRAPAPAPAPAAVKVAPAHVAKVEPPPPARPEPVRKPPAEPAKTAAIEIPHHADRVAEAKAAAEKAAAEREAKVKAEKLAAAEKAAAARKAAAERDAARAKLAQADAVKPAAKPPAPLVKAPAAKPVPAVPPKADQAAVAEPKKPVDNTPTASVPPASADAPPATTGAGGPEFRWPARGRIIAGFKPGAGGNDGINIAVPDGTPVKAAEGGVVAYAGSELKGYGNLVLIKHPNGYVTAYANNGELDVKRGETVKRGQTIAKSGQSGNVSSPQLHFELRKGSQPVDPTGFLAGL